MYWIHKRMYWIHKKSLKFDLIFFIFFYFKGHFSKNNFNTYSYELFCTKKLLSHFCNTVHWKLVQKCFLFKIKVYVGEQLKMSSSHSTSGMNGKWRRLHIHFDKCRRHILFPEWMGNDDVSSFPFTNVYIFIHRTYIYRLFSRFFR